MCDTLPKSVRTRQLMMQCSLEMLNSHRAERALVLPASRANPNGAKPVARETTSTNACAPPTTAAHALALSSCGGPILVGLLLFLFKFEQKK